ncbi:ATP-binding cassette domain-containing protein [Streptomyces sp. NPDC056296]|uniref:ATP-binding cassette domain-containing protein n=1 Tax=Streptomyces sp. NPDC056296 TaxID=3345775 RepID=UPI0035E2DC29
MSYIYRRRTATPAPRALSASESGEALAVLGENGAGKSTLLKSLTGAVHPDRGALERDGEQLRLRSPRPAGRLGPDPARVRICPAALGGREHPARTAHLVPPGW